MGKIGTSKNLSNNSTTQGGGVITKPSGFKDRAEEYIGGGIGIDDVFTPQDLKYIESNMENISNVMYRVEEGLYTAQDLDSGKLNSSNFKFSGTFRSFTSDIGFIQDSLDPDSDGYAYMRNPVIFEVTGNKKAFDMEPYATYYHTHFGSQSESLMGGNYSKTGEYYKDINGQKIRVIKLKQR